MLFFSDTNFFLPYNDRFGGDESTMEILIKILNKDINVKQYNNLLGMNSNCEGSYTKSSILM